MNVIKRNNFYFIISGIVRYKTVIKMYSYSYNIRNE